MAWTYNRVALSQAEEMVLAERAHGDRVRDRGCVLMGMEGGDITFEESRFQG